MPIHFFELLFIFFIYLIILYQNKSILYNQNSNKGVSYLVFFIIGTIFTTFPFHSADYYHYLKIYNEITRYGFAYHVEEIYSWLMWLLPKDYNIWRLVVWGCALYIYLQAFKRLGIKANIAGLTITLIILTYFPALRQSLGFGILFYGMTYIANPIQNKFKSYIIAAILIYISIYFHKSMPIYLAILAMSFIPMNRYVVIGSLLMFPIIYKYVIPLSDIVLQNFTEEETFQNSGEMYLNSEKNGSFTAWGWIQFIVTRTPIALTLGYFIKKLYFQKSQPNKYNNGNEIFFRYSYITFYIGALFFNQATSSFLSPRFMDASLYPLAISVAYELNYNIINKKHIRIFSYLFMLSNFYIYLYFLYKA